MPYVKSSALVCCNRGFSIVELMTAVAILIILTVLAIISVPGIRKQTHVEAAAHTILRSAFDARQRSSAINELRAGIFPNYGIMLSISEPDKIIIYADCVADDNADGILDDLDDFTYSPSSPTCSGGDLVEEITLKSESKIKSLKFISSSEISSSLAYLEFVRPQPGIWITDDSGNMLPFGRLEVVVAGPDGDHQRRINFWTSGRMEIE